MHHYSNHRPQRWQFGAAIPFAENTYDSWHTNVFLPFSTPIPGPYQSVRKPAFKTEGKTSALHGHVAKSSRFRLLFRLQCQSLLHSGYVLSLLLSSALYDIFLRLNHCNHPISQIQSLIGEFAREQHFTWTMKISRGNRIFRFKIFQVPCGDYFWVGGRRTPLFVH